MSETSCADDGRAVPSPTGRGLPRLAGRSPFVLSLLIFGEFWVWDLGLSGLLDDGC